MLEYPPDEAGLGSRFDQILIAARAGGEWAWRDLYRGTAPTLVRYLRARGTPDADDVVGETFIRVVRHIGGFAGDESAFRTWVFTIARNVVIDGARSSQRRPVVAVPDETLHALASVGDVETEAMQGLAQEHVRWVIEELSPDQRDVLLLRILGGFTIAEIADMLGRREGAVKMLQSRGLATLRKKISLKAVTL